MSQKKNYRTEHLGRTRGNHTEYTHTRKREDMKRDILCHWRSVNERTKVRRQYV